MNTWYSNFYHFTGSAADVCELQSGDEIVSVNGAEVGSHYLESVKLVLTQAARIGQVELVIKRSISQGMEWYFSA